MRLTGMTAWFVIALMNIYEIGNEPGYLTISNNLIIDPEHR